MTETTATPTALRDLDGTYAIDPSHSRVGFSTRHAMVTKVRGAFNEIEGTATTGTDLEGASIQVTMQAASVDTRSADRDGHLKSADFFDVETYPTITFTSTDLRFPWSSYQHPRGPLPQETRGRAYQAR